MSAANKTERAIESGILPIAIEIFNLAHGKHPKENPCLCMGCEKHLRAVSDRIKKYGDEVASFVAPAGLIQ